MLVGDRVHVSPVDGETELVRVTVPVKLLSGATVIVEVPATPAVVETVVGLAETEKSPAATLTVAVNVGLALTRVPEVPRIVV